MKTLLNPQILITLICLLTSCSDQTQEAAKKFESQVLTKLKDPAIKDARGLRFLESFDQWSYAISPPKSEGAPYQAIVKLESTKERVIDVSFHFILSNGTWTASKCTIKTTNGSKWPSSGEQEVKALNVFLKPKSSWGTWIFLGVVLAAFKFRGKLIAITTIAYKRIASMK